MPSIVLGPQNDGSTVTAPMIGALVDAALPPLQGHQLFSTQFDFVPVAMVVGAFGLYVWGVRRNNRLHPRHKWSAVKTAAFMGGLVSTGIAIFSFVGVYDGDLFWDHIVQHLLLIMVAAPLFALALTARSGLAGHQRHRPRGGDRSRCAHGVARAIGHPVVAFVLYAVMIPITHLTVWYNYTLQHETVHNAEHLVFLGIGYLFWRQIFGSEPNCYRMHPILQFGYLFLAIPIDTFTGLSLDQAVHEMFPAYLAIHPTWMPGPSHQ